MSHSGLGLRYRIIVISVLFELIFHLTFLISRKSSSKKKQTKRAGNTAVTENKTVEGLTKTNEINDAPLIDSKIVDEKKTEEQTETRVLKDKSVTPNGKAKPTTTRPKPPTKATKPKPKPPVKTTTKKPVNKNKTKTSEKSKPRAKGTLYGLSSLRRNGDVAVNILSDHTTVKSNFAVGPLVLRVEKEVFKYLCLNFVSVSINRQVIK